MLTRRGLDWTARFRPLVEAAARLPAANAYLDGEAAVLDEKGVSVFAELQDALSAGRAERVTYHVFDLLWLDGEDLRPLPLVQRKARLKKLLGKRPPARWPIRAMWSVGGLRSSADPPPEPPPAEPRAPASWRG